MPELPEVERGRLLAESALAGKTIARVQVETDDIVVPPGARALARALCGRRIESVQRWGKQLWFELDRPPHVLWHFGMTGAFHVPGDAALQLKAGPDVSGAAWPPRFLKVLLVMDDGTRFAFSDARRLRARKTPVKALLLDQKFCAGVGNWIADEVLYQARVDPRRRADTLGDDEVKRLRTKLRSIVRTAVKANADDWAYPRTWLFHRRWGKQGGHTMRGGHPIEFLEVGGRTTAWVPAVQR